MPGEVHSVPSRKRVVACLYSAQLSPIASFNSVYIGSKSKRGTDIRAFVIFGVPDGTGGVGLAAGAGGADVESVAPVRAAGSICIVNSLRPRRLSCAKANDVDLNPHLN